MHPLKVSIIIPYYKNYKNLVECVSACLELDYPEYEVIVVTNVSLKFSDQRVRVVLTDKVGQADKRDVGIANAFGEICAFIDDDASPRRDWIKNAVRYFEDPEIAAVGGPGVTPKNDNLLQRASGAIYSSFIGSGPLSYRYVPKKHRYVDDYPAYNLLVRKSILNEVSGFKTKFRSGEDTQLSLKIIKLGKKILYSPDVVVYHHRRPLFVSHLRQVRTYGLHRAYFSKILPQTSAKLVYFSPLILIMGFVVLTILSFINQAIMYALLSAIGFYLVLCFGSGLIISKDLKIALLTTIGIPLTHLVYGLSFLEGLLMHKLGERPSY